MSILTMYPDSPGAAQVGFLADLKTNNLTAHDPRQAGLKDSNSSLMTKESRYMLPFIVWRDEYSVDNPGIDKQHQGLLSLINDLYEAIRTRHSMALPRLLNQLEDYTKVHFATEERLLQECGYDGYESHKEYHDWMVQETIGLRVRFRLGDGDLSSAMFSFLKSWWVGHIQNIDRQYVSCVRANQDSHSP